MFTGKSDKGEFNRRSMIKGGAAGRRYRPNMNAEIAITANLLMIVLLYFYPAAERNLRRNCDFARHANLFVLVAPRIPRRSYDGASWEELPS